MHVELELTFLILALQEEELNSTNIPQRLHALLDLEEQRICTLDNLKKRQQTVKKYFDKRDTSTTFATDEKVLLWDYAHVDKGKHSKFHKLWLGPYIIAFVIGNNSYLLKDTYERLFSYRTNGSHMKHYVEPS